MKAEDKIAVPEQIKCDICLKEVPQTEALGFEAKDYVMHFCGLECFDKWQEGEDKDKLKE